MTTCMHLSKKEPKVRLPRQSELRVITASESDK